MLTVRDIMQKDVVTVTTDTTARDLARLLADEEISGVPVLDSGGQLAGVVSSSDLVRRAAEEPSVPVGFRGIAVGAPGPDAYSEFDDDAFGADPEALVPQDDASVDEPLLEESLESDFDTVLVRDVMTPVLFTVSPSTTVPALCEFLLGRSIHRAVVIDGGALAGIVTSSDVLRAVAQGRIASAVKATKCANSHACRARREGHRQAG
jgi:CBS domain-containing protein